MSASGPATTRNLRRATGGFVAAGIAVAVLGAMVTTLLGIGAGSRALDLNDGAFWVWSSHNGEASRVNASAGRVDLRLPFADASGSSVQLIQNDATLLLQDSSTGAVTSLDLSSLDITGTVTTSANARAVLYKDTVLVVDPASRTINQLEATTLRNIGKPVKIPADVLIGDFDSTGILWLAAPADGAVLAVTPGKNGPKIAHTVAVSNPGDDLRLSILDKGAAVVNLATSRMRTVSPNGESSSAIQLPNLTPLEVPSHSPGSVMVLTAPASREVIVVADDKSHQFTVPGDGPLARASYFADQVYIPDPAAHALHAYSPRGKKLDTFQTPSNTEGLSLEIIDGYLCLNDPLSETTMVIATDRSVVRVDKSPTDVPGSPLPSQQNPTPDSPTTTTTPPNPEVPSASTPPAIPQLPPVTTNLVPPPPPATTKPPAPKKYTIAHTMKDGSGKGPRQLEW